MGAPLQVGELLARYKRPLSEIGWVEGRNV